MTLISASGVSNSLVTLMAATTFSTDVDLSALPFYDSHTLQHINIVASGVAATGDPIVRIYTATAVDAPPKDILFIAKADDSTNLLQVNTPGYGGTKDKDEGLYMTIDNVVAASCEYAIHIGKSRL